MENPNTSDVELGQRLKNCNSVTEFFIETVFTKTKKEERQVMKAYSAWRDQNILSRLPKGRWFAAGSVSIHWKTLDRLVRLGLLERRYCPLGLKVSRTWDYRVTSGRTPPGASSPDSPSQTAPRT